MDYKRLGNSGLKVSSFCLGTMTFGDGADESMSKDIYTLCRDKGINFFDCANVYAEGESERILGKLISGSRNEVIITSKAYYPTSGDVNGRGSSRFHLTKALENSLKNLGTDYLDIFYLHNFDEDTPLEESLSTLNDFVRQGKVLYIGLSNFAAWQVMKAIAVCQTHHFAPVTCIQPMYNLLKRQCESELLPMAHDQGIGVCPYGPLAGGYLTGKYLNKSSNEGRFKSDEMYQKRYEARNNLKTVEAFAAFANKKNYDPVSLAIAWVLAHPAITAPLIGARNTGQLASAFQALEIAMPAALRDSISAFSLTPAMSNDRTEEQ